MLQTLPATDGIVLINSGVSGTGFQDVREKSQQVVFCAARCSRPLSHPAGPVDRPQRAAGSEERQRRHGACRGAPCGPQRHVQLPLDALAPGVGGRVCEGLLRPPAVILATTPARRRQGEEDAGDNGQNYHADYCTYLVNDLAGKLQPCATAFLRCPSQPLALPQLSSTSYERASRAHPPPPPLSPAACCPTGSTT